MAGLVPFFDRQPLLSTPERERVQVRLHRREVQVATPIEDWPVTKMTAACVRLQSTKAKSRYGPCEGLGPTVALEHTSSAHWAPRRSLTNNVANFTRLSEVVSSKTRICVSTH